MELTELEAAGLNASLYGPPADRVWLYVHGKGGCKEEAADFAALACPRGSLCLPPTAGSSPVFLRPCSAAAGFRAAGTPTLS